MVAGRSPLCNDPGSLGSVSDMDFSSNGDMVFSTKNGLYKLANDELGKVEFRGDPDSLKSISSLAVLPNGEMAFNNPDRLKVRRRVCPIFNIFPFVVFNGTYLTAHQVKMQPAILIMRIGGFFLRNSLTY